MFSVKSAMLAVGLLLPSEALAATRHYHWSMTYEGLPGQPDKMVVLINGKWPPESVEVEVDDKIIIDVDNVNVKDGISLHAHGFHQTNRNDEDGPVGVTQWYDASSPPTVPTVGQNCISAASRMVK